MNELVKVDSADFNPNNFERVGSASSLQVIDRREVLGRDFKIYGDFENPLFLAKDVATWIEHSNHRAMLESIDENEKGVRITYTPGGDQEAWFLTEDGLYEVLMQSRKPIAKQFKAAVKEVLRSIRRHGAYMTPAKIEEILLNPDTIIKLASALKDERAKSAELTAQVTELAPKAAFADAISATDGCIGISEAAKILTQAGFNVGQNRLFEVLVKEKLLFRNGRGDYEPYQRTAEMGIFRVIKNVITTPKKSFTSTTVKVTPKGQKYLVGRFGGGTFGEVIVGVI